MTEPSNELIGNNTALNTRKSSKMRRDKFGSLKKTQQKGYPG